ncbi:WSC domain-containing protein [Cercophora newfieldiana]|uniref:WSC domain-containing protein n=1 Tax=Cercophora newfieldiana TaxID=92897 RepID=A0AA40D0A2_9PEZI|nr:WSC domain-containing protein [Cercophora newfieldiana]
MAPARAAFRAASLLCLVATATALPQVSPRADVSPFSYLGCHSGKVNGGRALDLDSTGGDDITVESCAAFCGGYKYFGLEYGRECWCGNEQLAAAVDEDECSFPCSGDADQSCGAGAIQSLYINNRFVPRLPEKLKIPYIGCYAHEGNNRVLRENLLGSDDMTAAKCAAHCKDYEFFGVEYGRECWCGNTAPSVSVPESQCSFPCAGDSKTVCGAGHRINVWGTPLVAPPVVGEYIYQGCYTDKQDARALSGDVFRFDQMDPDICADACEGYPWFGLEYGTQCFCGIDLDASSKKVGGWQCAMECGGDPQFPCGDANRLNVYFNPNIAPISNPKTIGDYSAKGCFTDSQSKRSLSAAVLRREDMSIEMCAVYCRNFVYFGLEFGSQCFCGNSLGGVQVSEDQCGMLCVGNESELCGSADRLTVYSLDEDCDEKKVANKVAVIEEDEDE